MLVVFSGAKRVDHEEFLPARDIVTGQFNVGMLRRFKDWVRRARKEIAYNWLHDSVTPSRQRSESHVAPRPRGFGQKQDCNIAATSLQPDMAAFGTSVFSRIKRNLRGQRGNGSGRFDTSPKEHYGSRVPGDL